MRCTPAPASAAPLARTRAEGRTRRDKAVLESSGVAAWVERHRRLVFWFYTTGAVFAVVQGLLLVPRNPPAWIGVLAASAAFFVVGYIGAWLNWYLHLLIEPLAHLLGRKDFSPFVVLIAPAVLVGLLVLYAFDGRTFGPEGWGNIGAMFWTGLAAAANTIVRDEARI